MEYRYNRQNHKTTELTYDYIEKNGVLVEVLTDSLSYDIIDRKKY